MPKPSSPPTSAHNSQITFRGEDDVYHVNDPAPQSAKGSRTSAKGSRSSLKSSKGSIKGTPAKSGSKPRTGKSSENAPATSTPKSSQHQLSELDVSEIPSSKQTLEVQSGDYTPMPYIFRSLDPTHMREVKNVPTKCPPYYIQLDHTLAVVWILFSNKEVKKPVGIVQLQWALNFLSGIYNRKGEHPKDVALCIQQIQDQLIEQYADMVDDVQYIKRPPQGSESREKPKAKDKKHKSKSKPQASHSESELAEIENEIEVTGTPGAGEVEGGEDGEGCEDDTCHNKVCVDDKDEDIVLKQVPFSLNYAEMMSRSPPGVEELYPCCKDSKASSIASTTRKSTSGLKTSVSRDNMVEFLKAWRREQVEKIQSELKRLKSIENFIGSAEAENFSPYLDETQLDALVAQKINDSKGKAKAK